MRKVWEASGLYALEVHGLKTERWLTCAVSVVVSVKNNHNKLLFHFYLHQLCEEIHGYCRASVEEH